MTVFETILLYVLVYSISLFFLSFYKNKNKLIRFMGIFISILIPSILSGKRYGVGTDFYNYDYMCTMVRRISWMDLLSLENNFNVEKGYLVLTKLFAQIGSNGFVLGMITFVTLTLLIYAFLKNVKECNILVAYSIYYFYFYFTSYNLVRQMLAVSIVLCAYKYIFERKPIKFLFIIVLAMQIHYSAIVAIMAYVLWDGKKQQPIDVKKFVPPLIVAMAFIAYWRNILLFITNYVPWFAKYRYLLQDNDANNRDFIVKIGFLIIFLLVSKYYKSRDNRLLLYVYMYALAVVIGFAGFQITFIKRLGMYFEIVAIVLWATMPDLFKWKSSKLIAKIGVVCIFFAYFILSAVVLKQAHVVPYNWR